MSVIWGEVMTAGRRLVVIVAATAVMVVGTVASAGAAGGGVTSGPRAVVYRLHAVAGDSQYLVYTKGRTRALTRELMVRDLSGTTRRIATLGIAAADFTVAGDVLIYLDSTRRDGDGPIRYRWYNLATGAHGLFPQQPFTGYIALPHGWIDERSRRVADRKVWVLMRHTFAGHVTRLGEPFPDGARFAITYGGGDAVAYNEFGAHGGAVWRSVQRPGRFRTLVPSNGRGGGNSSADCPSATSAGVACEVYRHGRSWMHLDSLQGEVVATTSKCAMWKPAMLGRSLAWVSQAPGCGHRLHILDPNGSTVVTGPTLAVNEAISAYGGVVASNTSHTRLLYYTEAAGFRPIAGRPRPTLPGAGPEANRGRRGAV